MRCDPLRFELHRLLSRSINKRAAPLPLGARPAVGCLEEWQRLIEAYTRMSIGVATLYPRRKSLSARANRKRLAATSPNVLPARCFDTVSVGEVTCTGAGGRSPPAVKI